MQDNQGEIYKAIIGPKNQDYYLTKFSRFDSNGKVGVSWHWPAFFVTFYWLLYRKMWLYAFLYLLGTYMLGKLIEFVSADIPTAIVIAYIFYLMVIFLLPAIYANAIYYSHCNEKITETTVSAQDSESLLKTLSKKGGVSKAALIFVIIVFMCVIGIVAAIAIPAYQDYLIRAGG